MCMRWFNEELIDTDAKAFGVYLALLKARFQSGWFYKESFQIPPIIDEVKREISKFLTGRDMYEASKASEEFLILLHEHEAEKLRQDKSILDEIEAEYYESFKGGVFKYFKGDYINDDIKNIIRTFLKDVRSGKMKWYESYMGSVRLGWAINSRYTIDNYWSRFRIGWEEIIRALTTSGIVVFDDIIPAPFLEDEFIERLAPPEEFEEKEEIIPKIEEEKPKYHEKPPTREILESIVSDVLKDLGFKVETNKRLKAKGSGDIEVDVWGIKFIGNTRFYVYASCKNWNKDVDRTVIDGEYGRTLQLIQSPHLKIFIAKKLTEPARETALADGFIVIELGEKASSKNAEEIYNLIYSHLKELFIGIAPPELQRFAKEAKEISERLKNLAEEIERISA